MAVKSWRDQVRIKVTPAEVEIDPKSTALIIVDAQNLSCHPTKGVMPKISQTFPEEGKYMLDRVTRVFVPNNKKLLKFFRDNKLKVFFCQMGPQMPDASDLYTIRKIGDAQTQKRTGAHFIYGPGTFEYETIDELKPLPGELVVNKRTRSAFVGTFLDHTLKMVGIESLVITGACTDICVLATALNAIDLGYKGILVDDACATFDQTGHDWTMRTFEAYFSKVVNTDQIIAELSKKLK